MSTIIIIIIIIIGVNQLNMDKTSIMGFVVPLGSWIDLRKKNREQQQNEHNEENSFFVQAVIMII